MQMLQTESTKFLSVYMCVDQWFPKSGPQRLKEWLSTLQESKEKKTALQDIPTSRTTQIIITTCYCKLYIFYIK